MRHLAGGTAFDSSSAFGLGAILSPVGLNERCSEAGLLAAEFLAKAPAAFEAWQREQLKPAIAPAGESASKGFVIFTNATYVCELSRNPRNGLDRRCGSGFDALCQPQTIRRRCGGEYAVKSAALAGKSAGRQAGRKNAEFQIQ